MSGAGAFAAPPKVGAGGSPGGGGRPPAGIGGGGGAADPNPAAEPFGVDCCLSASAASIPCGFHWTPLMWCCLMYDASDRMSL